MKMDMYTRQRNGINLESAASTYKRSIMYVWMILRGMRRLTCEVDSYASSELRPQTISLVLAASNQENVSHRTAKATAA